MEANVRTRPVLGVDVGKQSHWRCLVTVDGEVALNASVANREHGIDELLASLPGDTLAVVDQVRNIGSLVLKRTEAAGLDRAYLPGIAVHGASKPFAGDAKTDGRDALVIAKTAIGIPDSLLPVPKANAATDAARAMASQRDFLVTCATRDKNRLRSVLLESCPAFEPLVGLSEPHCLRMISEFDGHDKLASYCGLAPRNRQSGTSISSVTASRQGNKRLKNLLVFSCNSLVRSDNRFGDLYRKCRDRGMPHGKALKAVARRRLKVIYAIMRDQVPYAV